MKPPDEQVAARQAALEAAQRALEAEDIPAARRHLDDAAAAGAPRREVTSLRKAIDAQDKSSRRRGVHAKWVGLALAAVGYIILSFQQPTGWGPRLWAALALLVVPAVAGFAAGRLIGLARSAGGRFRTGFWIAALPMFLYAAINMLIVRSRIESSGGAGAVLLVGLFAAVVYTLVAGLVAGLVSSLAWLGKGEGGAA